MNATVEHYCEVMHDAYEKAAAGAGWETNLASRKPWAEVPEANKVTMRAAVAALLEEIHVRPVIDPAKVQTALESFLEHADYDTYKLFKYGEDIEDVDRFPEFAEQFVTKYNES